MPRLTPEQKTLIPSTFAELGSISAVARKFGVTPAAIRPYVKGKTKRGEPTPASELADTTRERLERKVLRSLDDIASEILQVRDELREKNGQRVAVEWTTKQLTLIAQAVKSIQITVDQRAVHLNGQATDVYAQAVRQIEARLRGKVSDEVLLLVGEALK